ncbi:aspartate 1-decarboxylase [candidate division KSB1 bacterium]|nr:aspartate 1-decarboxylase [candidate division KSB1 bacterium]
MKREVLGAKIHNARVTQLNIEYEGSCAIDHDLLDQAGILPYERVHIYNVMNGERFDTYAIPGKRGSGLIGLNGAAARLAVKGDRVIIVTYVQLDEDDPPHKALVVVLDEHNRPVKQLAHRIGRKP